MSDVFISYKRRLRPRVEQIASELERLGLSVWFDAELEPGTSFSGEISHEVRSAKCVLVCWTNDAFPHGGDEHGWVVGEATIGRNRKVLVATVLEPTDLDPPWNTVHCEDLSDWGPKSRRSARLGWQNVIEAIGKHVGRPGLAELDRALVAGSIRALTGWLDAFADDPASESVRVEVERRRERRKPRPLPKYEVPVPVLNADGDLRVPPPDTDNDLAAAVEKELLSNEATVREVDDNQAWLERDLALTEDLSFERKKLEEAVESALQIATEEPTHHDTMRLSAEPPIGPVTALATGATQRTQATLFACTAATALSSGIALFVAFTGWAETPLGSVIFPLVCPAAFGAIVGRFGGGDLPFVKLLLMILVAPIVAVSSALLGTLAQAFMPISVGGIVFGAVSSFVGAVSYRSILSVLGAQPALGATRILVGGAVISILMGLCFWRFDWSVSGMTDVAGIILLWETTFSTVMILGIARPNGIEHVRA